MKNESSIDRLSDLPDSILSHILSFLPTKYAVRTSVLSTRWRYLFTLLTKLDFEANDYPSDGFMNFVDRVLFYVTAGVQSFRVILGLIRGRDADRLCDWLKIALERRLNELYLAVPLVEESTGLLQLPASLFTSKTLVKLELNLYLTVLNIPIEVCFPNLKTLYLENVDFVDNDSARRLLTSCLVLEELFIRSHPWLNGKELHISNSSLKRLTISHYVNTPVVEMFPLSRVVVDTPNLVYLKLSDVLADSYLFLNLNSLVKVDCTNLFAACDEPQHKDKATGLLRGISNVQSLRITSDFYKIFNLCDKRPVFNNVVHLEISYNLNLCVMGALVLLKYTPKLRTLIYTGALERQIWRPPRSVPSCLLYHLKVIEIHSLDDQMDMVEYFLENASVLERLKIKLGMEVEERLEITKKLLMLPRKSKICKVEIA